MDGEALNDFGQRAKQGEVAVGVEDSAHLRGLDLRFQAPVVSALEGYHDGTRDVAQGESEDETPGARGAQAEGELRGDSCDGKEDPSPREGTIGLASDTPARE